MPLELEFKITVLEHKWRQSNDEERLDILLSLLNENFVLHSELTRRDKERKDAEDLLLKELFSAPKSQSVSVNLPPVPPPPEPKKEFPVGFCFDFWRLTVAVWWGKRQ
jgi:hypothetical protein